MIHMREIKYENMKFKRYENRYSINIVCCSNKRSTVLSIYEASKKESELALVFKQ